MANYIELSRLEHNWRWSTAATYLGQLLSALSTLWLYADGAPYLAPQRWSVTSEAMSTIKRMARGTDPEKAVRASYADVKQAAAAAGEDNLKAAILVSWFTLARVGNSFKLRKDAFEFLPEGKVAVTFRSHKTEETAGIFTVHTTVDDQEVYDFLKRHVAAMKHPTSQLVPCYSRAQADAVRTRSSRPCERSTRSIAATPYVAGASSD